ncbi:unnamed protein product [Gongylonema pulchrum]|uniref:Cytospin-A n=1 Tax=Gongylonema pulchrum TaxID=637853 RepID=A0A183ERK4_9BILA|nr:unnamed protein product [Gongylonema pulchrum]
MGCRFSRSSSDTELELNTDSVTGLNRSSEKLPHSESKTRSVSEQLKLSNLTAPIVSENSIGGATTSFSSTRNARPLVRRDTPARSAFLDRATSKPKVLSSIQESNAIYVNKPLGQVGSTSQADFFRMLDEKIAQVS